MMPTYSMLIQWSEPDQAFLVSFPEVTGDAPQTHGATYEEAARNGQDALELLLQSLTRRGEQLPEPHVSRFSEGAASWRTSRVG